MNIRTVTFWIATAITVVVLALGGLTYLFRAKFAVDAVASLGYPVYVTTILGVWKLLAVPALLAPGFPRLKEWAYAGIVFDLTGAAASHIFSNDPIGHVFLIGVLLVAAFLSWALRSPSRKLVPAPAGPTSGEAGPGAAHVTTAVN